VYLQIKETVQMPFMYEQSALKPYQYSSNFITLRDKQGPEANPRKA
jgi:hypothetical protein